MNLWFKSDPYWTAQRSSKRSFHFIRTPSHYDKRDIDRYYQTRFHVHVIMQLWANGVSNWVRKLDEGKCTRMCLERIILYTKYLILQRLRDRETGARGPSPASDIIQSGPRSKPIINIKSAHEISIQIFALKTKARRKHESFIRDSKFHLWHRVTLSRNLVQGIGILYLV